MSGTGSDLPQLYLKAGEERRLSAGHVWVFSNEIDTNRSPLAGFKPGSLCAVMSSRERFMGYAYANPHSLITARLLSRHASAQPDQKWLIERLQSAYALRQALYSEPYYRCVHGEGDGLPGLVLDRFDDVVVGQIATAGMEEMRPQIEAAVRSVLSPSALLWKNDAGVRALEGLPSYEQAAFGGERATLQVREGGLDFQVAGGAGQKTGWFYDQAPNRLAMRKYAPGARVLDVFSYVGAWGLGALRAGAREALCVDASAAALESVERNAQANGLQPHTRRGDAFDVLQALHAEGRKFDVVIIDPPAFIKRKKDLPKGEAAYRRLNQLAMQLLDREGFLISCSCSYHLPAESLINAIQRAARQLDRFAQIIEVGGQGPDHPVHPAIVETRYLKAFFVRVTPA